MNLHLLLLHCDTYSPRIVIFQENLDSPIFEKPSHTVLDFYESFHYDVVHVYQITQFDICLVVKQCKDI